MQKFRKVLIIIYIVVISSVWLFREFIRSSFKEFMSNIEYVGF